MFYTIATADNSIEPLYNSIKKEYISTLISETAHKYAERINMSDNKSMWSICNEIVEKISQTEIEGDPEDIANQYNTFLINAIKYISPHHSTYSCINNIPANKKSMVTTPVTPQEIVNINKSIEK